MNPEQRIAVLEATVGILERNQGKLEQRIEKVEEQITQKLDLLISQSNFVKGILKAMGGLITVLTLASPFVVRYMMG